MPRDPEAIEHADDVDDRRCPVCNGAGWPLGDLGRVHWYRCRRCGWDWHHGPSDAAMLRIARQDARND